MNEDMSKILEEIKKLVEEKKYSGGTFLNEDLKTILDYITNLQQEIERLNKTLEDIDTYIHLWKLEEIGEKTMLILNDILLIKNGMSDEVVRLKDSDKE